MKYHYVYRITNIKENKHYYGCRSSKVEPKFDLGIKYFSSSKDKEFMNEQKVNPALFKYKIIKMFKSREEAINLEIKLHSKFDVGRNKSFYNRSKQISIGFDTTGLSFNKGIKKSEESIQKRLITMYTENKNGIRPIDMVSMKLSETLKSKEYKDKIGYKLLLKNLEKDINGLNHFQKMSKKGNAKLTSVEYRQSENFKISIIKQKNTRNKIMSNGKSFQYNVAQKSKETKIKNSPHYNIFNSNGIIVEYNVSRQFVREKYTNILQYKTKNNPITSNNSKYKGFYSELITINN